MNTAIPAPIPSMKTDKGRISRITVESGDGGQRFVVSILVSAQMAQSNLRAQLAGLHRRQDAIKLAAADQPLDAVAQAEYDQIEQQIMAGQAEIATLVDIPAHYEYFSTPMGSTDSVRINTQQLRNAFPDLMPVKPDEKVFVHLLTHRSSFVGREVTFTVTPQIDKDTKQVKRGPKGQVYTNVRLEASSDNLSEADALQLLSGNNVIAGNPTTAEQLEDIPM